MKLYFVTQNPHKVEEAKAVLSKYNIKFEQINEDYPEDKESTIQEIAKTAAKQLAEKHQKTIIVDDTGIFFTDFKNFPGPNAKLMFNSIGYEGLLKLLAGKKRDAYFLTCVGFCRPNEEPIIFEGKSEGHISQIPFNLEKEVMPYERIFVPNHYTQTLSSLPREEKNKFSHRAKAFKKLAEYLNS